MTFFLTLFPFTLKVEELEIRSPKIIVNTLGKGRVKSILPLTKDENWGKLLGAFGACTD